MGVGGGGGYLLIYFKILARIGVILLSVLQHKDYAKSLRVVYAHGTQLFWHLQQRFVFYSSI